MKIYLIPVPLTEEFTDSRLFVSPRVLNALAETNYFLVENLRTARRFISSLKTGRKIDDMQFFLLDKTTDEATIQGYFKQIPQDACVGIMSEAGSPAIADPGSKAVDYAHRKGLKVVPLEGASSLWLALAASGLNGQSFAFQGYLPINNAERLQAIKNFEAESRKRKQTQLFIETPFRNNAVLEALLQNLAPTTLLCVASNLQTDSEWILTQKVSQWKSKIPDLHKKPTVFLFLC